MAKERTKSIDDIFWQGAKLSTAIEKALREEKDPERRKMLNQRWQRVNRAQKRYTDNITGTKAYTNDMQRREDTITAFYKARQDKDADLSTEMLNKYKKQRIKMDSRKYKGYTNAATTASVK